MPPPLCPPPAAASQRRSSAPLRPARACSPRAAEDPESEGPIPFSASKASPRVWSVSRSMGSDHQRPWVKVLPLSLLCSGLLLWCAFRERTEIDERLEVLLSGQIVDPTPPASWRSRAAAARSSAPLRMRAHR
uniref:Protein CCSMST1 n=1 Tax=Phasianus colchicus TaxID=9054 RepID=A0A669QBR4_PHACC